MFGFLKILQPRSRRDHASPSPRCVGRFLFRRGPATSFKPALEALEERRLLSINFTRPPASLPNAIVANHLIVTAPKPLLNITSVTGSGSGFATDDGREERPLLSRTTAAGTLTVAHNCVAGAHHLSSNTNSVRWTDQAVWEYAVASNRHDYYLAGAVGSNSATGGAGGGKTLR
jgi:hypothetical protein